MPNRSFMMKSRCLPFTINFSLKNMFHINSWIGNFFLAWSKPIRIYPPDWIRCIFIEIITTGKSNRILIYKPPDFRVAIPETVVMQPAFFVVILSLKAERLLLLYCVLQLLNITTNLRQS